MVFSVWNLLNEVVSSSLVVVGLFCYCLCWQCKPKTTEKFFFLMFWHFTSSSLFVLHHFSA